jgi:hypothetical protein
MLQEPEIALLDLGRHSLLLTVGRERIALANR